MIELQGVSHFLGQKQILKDITVQIPENTVLGIVGVNGAGKSTLLRLLSGVYLPDRGSILYDGKPPKEAATRREIFFLSDDPYYAAHTTPRSLFDFYRAFYPRIDRALFEEMLSDYGIGQKELLRNFSKGMRRQVFVALALASNATYLLLDEAFDGLDSLSRKRFKEYISAWLERSGGTVLIASHSLKEVEEFCDRFLLIDEQTVSRMGEIADEVEQFCKFDLAFLEQVDEGLFAGLPVVHLTVRGKFAQIVLRGDATQMQDRLAALSPAVMEEAAIDFEDAFIYDVNKKGEYGK